MMTTEQEDRAIRQRAFEFLAEAQDLHGDVLPRSVLAAGFQFNGQRIPLVSPQGIFKPKALDIPLTISTVPNSPYNDLFEDDGRVTYCYRGTDPKHPDNAGLRKAMDERLPLIYFHGVTPGKYLATWPVYIIADMPEKLRFSVAVDDAVIFPDHKTVSDITVDIETKLRRRYVTRTVTTRLHQRTFRERVISAYKKSCAMCNLKHQELLDAAHITGDADAGEPVVSNGIALCKIHHAAFDRQIIGIRPDYTIEVRADILREVDGPMLKYGLQSMNNLKLQTPTKISQRPDRTALENRYQKFASIDAHAK